MTTPPIDTQAPPAIQFTNVSKRFKLDTLKQRTLLDLAGRLLGRREAKNYFWPLRDVTFAVPRGVTVGLIGENGSGKSTLLKLISRILQPTGGTVQIRGRVSALLELGAGFHPELSGRDNIYLHAALLGHARERIDTLVEPIVRYADIGDFIDTPVKHYSSGMFARLGFAIAVHVEPDILLVDEVLAVGDEAFQRRCLDTFEMMQSRGATILLVSHSLSQVLSLCDQCIWLHDGVVRAMGDTQEVVRSYLAAVDDATAQRLIQENALQDWMDDSQPAAASLRPPRRWGNGPIRITHVRMMDENRQEGWSFRPLQPVRIVIDYTAQRPIETPIFSVLVHKQDGHYLWASNTDEHPVPPILQAGAGQAEVEIAGMALTAGRYRLSAAVYPERQAPYWRQPSDFHEQLYEFQVVSQSDIHGDVVMPSRWLHITDASDNAAAHAPAKSDAPLSKVSPQP